MREFLIPTMEPIMHVEQVNIQVIKSIGFVNSASDNSLKKEKKQKIEEEKQEQLKQEEKEKEKERLVKELAEKQAKEKLIKQKEEEKEKERQRKEKERIEKEQKEKKINEQKQKEEEKKKREKEKLEMEKAMQKQIEQSAVYVEAVYSGSEISNPSPKYPIISKKEGEEGEVVLLVKISANGNPLSITIYKSSGYERLDNASVYAVKEWRFIPAKNKFGKNVESSIKIPFVFKIKSYSIKEAETKRKQ